MKNQAPKDWVLGIPDESIWWNISALDHRYRMTFKELRRCLSEAALLYYMALVELALVRVFHRHGICSAESVAEVEKAVADLDPDRVAVIEKSIGHDVRALAEALREKVSDATKPYIHWLVTSFDVKGTAEAARFRDACTAVIIPEMMELERLLLALALRHKDDPQMGRTHGQHAEPITLGFTLMSYAHRFGDRIQRIQAAAQGLRGKVSGAVGAHNSIALFFDDPLAFEKEVLAELDLQPDPFSTQIPSPEPMIDLMYAMLTAGGVLGNIGDDMRNLGRTEIGEVYELFMPDQVGSSTMPHKRNPWNFENVKSQWKKLVGGLLTALLDQISEHQRDLTNSSSARDNVEIAANLLMQIERTRRTLSSCTFGLERMREHIHCTKGVFLAEPLYLLLAQIGHPDAHERVKQLTLEAEATGSSLQSLAGEAEDLQSWLEEMEEKKRVQLQAMFAAPEGYCGIAGQKTELRCQEWAERLGMPFDEIKALAASEAE